MVALNARAKLDHVPESEVAAAFLNEARIAGAVAAADESWPRALARRAAEHATLVGLSLLAAIAVAVPLGVVAARRPRLGRLVVGAAGLLQTIPSIALLVLLIPLLGIGTPPALVALFLYGLLPIVRNTHAGLVGIPEPLRDSARALGLPPSRAPPARRAPARACRRSWPASRPPPSSPSAPPPSGRWSEPAASDSRS